MKNVKYTNFTPISDALTYSQTDMQLNTHTDVSLFT